MINYEITGVRDDSARQHAIPGGISWWQVFLWLAVWVILCNSRNWVFSRRKPCRSAIKSSSETFPQGHGSRGKTLALASGTFCLVCVGTNVSYLKNMLTVLQLFIDPLRIGREAVARWRTEFVVEEALFFDILWCPDLPFPLLSFVWSSLYLQNSTCLNFEGKTVCMTEQRYFHIYLLWGEISLLSQPFFLRSPWMDSWTMLDHVAGFRAACRKRSCALWWHRYWARSR